MRTSARWCPIYIAEILFLQGKYDEMIAYVKPLLEDPGGAKRINEINRLAGEANYRTRQVCGGVALPARRAPSAPVWSASDRYILGYTYYKTGDLPEGLGPVQPGGERRRTASRSWPPTTWPIAT